MAPQRESPAGDVDYTGAGSEYASVRRTDPRIASAVHSALADARTVLNVGAGAGSYEPDDRWVLAVEPSAAMRAQRPRGAPPALDAAAEELPFDDAAFDACMATMTVHQWTDPYRGLAELRRVARHRVVVLTFDAAVFGRYWLLQYIPELDRIDRGRLKSRPNASSIFSAEADASKAWMSHMTAPTALWRPITPGRSLSQMRPYAPASPGSGSLQQKSSNEGCKIWPMTSRPEAGTSGSATFGSRLPTRARCVSWSRSS